MSKILITGNGFDLFHHLPTKYHHFIAIMITIVDVEYDADPSFDKLFGRVFEKRHLDEYNLIEKNYNTGNIKFNLDKINEIKQLLKSNLWYKYFKNVLEIDTWIDFEMEVETILNQVSILLNSETHQSKKINQYRDIPINYYDFELFGIIEFKFDNREIISIPDRYLDKRKGKIKSRDIFSDLAKSFEDFIMIFNRYLVDIVSVFYDEIKQKTVIPFHLMNEIYTFNYTPTLEKIYNVDESKVVYLHGKMNENDSIQNIVLGVSDVSKEVKSTKMFDFAKYYQKVNKKCNKQFIKIPSKDMSYSEETIFYVVGHSLDKSDSEYVLELFKFLEADSMEKSKICVFYYNDTDRENKIRNLFSIVDEKIISKVNREERLYFVELNLNNINAEFKKIEYKRFYDIR